MSRTLAANAQNVHEQSAQADAERARAQEAMQLATDAQQAKAKILHDANLVQEQYEQKNK